MKIRNGFVSNSSSSSFIVISEDESTYRPPTLSANFFIGDDGRNDFGWQDERYWDFESKLNFAFLQAKAASEDNNDNWTDMLWVVLGECGAIEIDEDMDKWSHIDHQSAYCEGENCEMFESEEQLRNFLFNTSSYIQCENDNEKEYVDERG